MAAASVVEGLGDSGGVEADSEGAGLAGLVEAVVSVVVEPEGGSDAERGAPDH